MSILRVDGSMRRTGSISRKMTDELIATLRELDPGVEVVTRDLAEGAPLVDENWIGANFTPRANRTEAQQAILAPSNALVAELQAADTIVIGAPIYNFGVSAALKAWVDQIARIGVTFYYTDKGPKGLLSSKVAYLVVASGGTDMNSEIDFATGYMRHVLGFVGVTDVRVIDASAHMRGEDAALARARTAFPAAA